MKKIMIIMGLISSLFAIEHCGAIESDETWSAADEHLLTCQTFVKDGVTLTIEAGTTVKSVSDDGAGLAPALVIEQGGKIMAEGTADSPITFRSNLEEEDMVDLRGNWGGLILNGYAPISSGTNFVEGLEGVPYGGNNPDDNSGVLKYVRVWHGGRSIGQDNEINGITLAGVGRGTSVSYCEVAWNLDDGFEMFGGTVDLHHCSVYNVGDDSFDTDEGYQGRGQFLYVHKTSDSDRCMEMDNQTNGDLDSQPRSHPQFSNMTCIGGDADSDMAKLREGTGGDHRNLILVDGAGDGIENEDNGSELVTQDLGAGTYPDFLYISSNTLMHNVANPWKDTTDDLGFTNQSGDPGIESGDVTPDADGPAYDAVDTVIADGWFVQTDYKGAFAADDNWLDGWSWASGSFDNSVSYPVVLNEFLASSELCCGEDEIGSNEDFIELYNSSDSDLDISGWGFNDTSGEIASIAPQGTIIAAGGYLVVYFAGEADAWPMVDAKLSSDGEVIYIADANGNTVIDFAFGPQMEDVSMSWNGTDYVADYCPSPGADNEFCGPCLDGDVSGDGLLNVLDVVNMVQAIVNQATDTLSCGDISGDDIINVIDVVQLVQIIVNSRVNDATSATLNIKSNNVSIDANGYIGGVQMTLFHGNNFSLDLTDKAYVADYNTQGNETILVIVAPESDELFTFNGDFEISEYIVANSNSEVNTTISEMTFNLSNAFPNPFNPTTSFTLTIPSDGYVNVSIYNLVGQQIDQLVSGNMESGIYNLNWNASNLTSGMYLVRAEFSGSIVTQKLMLLK